MSRGTPKKVWRRPDAQALLPLDGDWVRTRRALDRADPPAQLQSGAAAPCCDSDPRAICESLVGRRACPTWSVHVH
jgi:hypothetical protein